MKDRYSRERRRALASLDAISRCVPLDHAHIERCQRARRILRKRMTKTNESDFRALVQVVTDLSEMAIELIERSSREKTS